MAMNLRLDDAEAAALRKQAAVEGRSMNDVVRSALHEYISHRRTRLTSAIERVRTEDAELLARLAK
ncbi:FitA-like ribbon-helix-helix domain-containing protein [Tessaracoccus massiliensis]|uniref:FitA-like ribbon-helix-helix domain-containing protein n=1 Tax=Tessaracoccus massiliensis TaxID=1522311 RepID=UPI00058FC646|nr:ribbon-helix-helix protein, CopG family [Tessaracoccus massiliensis]